MPPTHSTYLNFMRDAHGFHHISSVLMMDTEAIETRTLTIVLPESEWRALRAQEPDAVGWLQAQIRQRLEAGASCSASSPVTATETFSAYDDY